MEDSENTIIKVQGVSKIFKLPHEKTNTIKSSIIHMGKRDKGYEEQLALEDISFEVKSGEFFGIVGRNGSGKSTLLKMLAGIYVPTKGNIEVNGNLTPFIELGVGFSPELTGRENVYLNGSLLGFNRKEMALMYDDIVEFAELERFMDQKLKNYSSGMQVRLAFSIAIQAKSEILLIDEVLAVGDVSFQEKCFQVFKTIKQSNRTVVFVSHDLSSVQEFCDRVALIDQGMLIGVGEPEDMILKYETRMARKLNNSKSATPNKDGRPGSGEYKIGEVEVYDSHDKPALSIKEGEEFTIVIAYKRHRSINQIVCGISINDTDDLSIIGPNTDESKLILTQEELGKEGTIKAKFKLNPLSPGIYTVTVGLFNERGTSPLDFYSKAQSFKVIGKARHGKITTEPAWKISKLS